MRSERTRREESRFRRLLRALGLRSRPPRETVEPDDLPPEAGVREPRRPRPRGPRSGAAVLDPPDAERHGL